MSRKARVTAVVGVLVAILLAAALLMWPGGLPDDMPDSGTGSGEQGSRIPPAGGPAGDEGSDIPENWERGSPDEGPSQSRREAPPKEEQPGGEPSGQEKPPPEPVEPVDQPAEGAQRVSIRALEREAAEYIEEDLLARDPEPRAVRKTGMFVPPDQKLKLPDVRRLRTTPEKILTETELPPDEPIRVIYSRKREVTTTLAELRKNPDVGPATPLTIREGEGDPFGTTLRELEESGRFGPHEPFTRILKNQVVERTTPRRLAGLEGQDRETPITVLEEEDNRIATIAELLGPERTADAEVFYVHRVGPEDNQGLWGIIQDGVEKKFRKGVALSGAGKGVPEEPVRLDIPPTADERLPDGRSSFLGKVLHRKTRTAFVYNFLTDRMGGNRDLIYPGEQILIVPFTRPELVAIYKHFAGETRKADATGNG